MKRIMLLLLGVVAWISANAITLFPHFVDVAGDYEEGTAPKFTQLNIPTGCWRMAPRYYDTIESAEEFLNDTLPFSNYAIERDAKKLPDGTIIITYTSSLEADGLNKDKWSKLYLVQTPGEPLYVGLYEDKI